MKSVNIHEAKTHLSRILERVATGEEIIISKAGKPVAKLVPFDSSLLVKRKLGVLTGKIRIASDFDAPLPEDLLSAFAGQVE